MVPSSFILLNQLPLSPNGKIDRSALPKPSANILQRNHQDPQNEYETQILNIWSNVLNINPKSISTKDSFFELGGNSLLLISVYNQIHTNVDRSITIDKIFQYPTIQSFAMHLNKSNNLVMDLDKINKRASKQKANLQIMRNKGRQNE